MLYISYSQLHSCAAKSCHISEVTNAIVNPGASSRDAPFIILLVYPHIITGLVDLYLNRSSKLTPVGRFCETVCRRRTDEFLLPSVSNYLSEHFTADST